MAKKEKQDTPQPPKRAALAKKRKKVALWIQLGVLAAIIGTIAIFFYQDSQRFSADWTLKRAIILAPAGGSRGNITIVYGQGTGTRFVEDAPKYYDFELQSSLGSTWTYLIKFERGENYQIEISQEGSQWIVFINMMERSVWD